MSTCPEIQRDWRWCNLSAPWWRVGRVHVRLWNLFNRCAKDDHTWGLGVLQIGQRHLLFVGSCGGRVLFVGRTP